MWVGTGGIKLRSETESGSGKDNAQRKDRDKEPLSLTTQILYLHVCTYGTVGTGRVHTLR